VQNAKDTFYEMLRGRLAALNPGRTIVLRGVVRPGVLVEENELVSTVVLPDCFRVNWTQAAGDPDGDLATIALQCEIEYETAGTALNGGMDRGRALSAMDAELQATINKYLVGSARLRQGRDKGRQVGTDRNGHGDEL